MKRTLTLLIYPYLVLLGFAWAEVWYRATTQVENMVVAAFVAIFAVPCTVYVALVAAGVKLLPFRLPGSKKRRVYPSRPHLYGRLRKSFRRARRSKR